MSSRVVIIGCGAAGISAARTFYQTGIDCVVLEATDRYGGRVKDDIVYSDRNDQYISLHMGANWIHGLNPDNNPFAALAKKLSVKLHQTSSDDDPSDDVLLFDQMNLNSGYSVLSQAKYSSALLRYEWMKERIHNYAERRLSLIEAWKKVLSASTSVFGECDDWENKVFNWFFDRISIDLATNLSNISSLDDCNAESDGAEGEALVIGGYYQLIQHIYNEYPLDVRYNSVVSNISCLPYGGVQITCTNGDSYFAERCLITVPIGVLSKNSISFSPKVPLSIEQITKCYRPGLMNLVWIWFPRKFWPEGYNFFGVTRDSTSQVKLSTFLVPKIKDNYGVEQAVLMCQVVDDFAREIEDMSDSELSNIVMNTLRSMFADVSVPEPIVCRHSSWSKQPFAGCSWSYLSIDRDDEIRGCLSDEAVLYAGEADNKDYQGTVHGAYLSGERRALQIIDSLSHDDMCEEKQVEKRTIQSYHIPLGSSLSCN